MVTLMMMKMAIGDENYEQWKSAWVHFHPVALLQLQAMHSP